MADLTVFDLQRFALNDGPGIRTTVFTKGCPLDCIWCHNPESKKTRLQLGFLEKKCTNCGRCVAVCTNLLHKITKDGEHIIDYVKCTQCGRCVDTCLNNALKIIGKKMGTEEILKTVMRDVDFYRKSGGGLTVSGGEPMMQFQALLELLKAAKERGLHVCLDTCGQAPENHIAEIAEYVDVFLFDYKITGSQQHKKYTEVNNNIILDNLHYLCTHGKRVFLRCPIIPRINDNEWHYKGIAALSQKYDAIVQVNLLTYHDMAKGKASQIGEEFALANIKTIEAEKKRKIYKKVKSYGCLKLIES